jgi:transcription initiation factor TFIID subunit 5
VASLDGHQNSVTALDFSQDGSLLASSSLDCTVRIWDPKKATNNTSSDVSMSSLEESAAESRSTYLLATFATKCTPIFHLQFSRRNILLAAGPFLP